MLHQKNILLGITGGIAAYKCAHLVRLFVKHGANVKVITTNAANEFVSPKTLSVLSKNQVITDFFDANNNWNNHVHLAEWADVFVIAPLTANTLAKMANGMCDNVLLATYLSCKTKTVVAPAMDLDMYQHATTKENLSKLINFGNLIIPATSGELASGLIGEGRMAEPEAICEFVINYFKQNQPLFGKQILINAGPTYEAIDPVRFIGNRSSGKMGVALAHQFLQMGAEVTLVLGPSNQKVNSKINLIEVESGDEMYNACITNFDNKDIVVCSAAVADYKPKEAVNQKIKKKTETLNLELVKTKDILAELGLKKKKQFLVGFALETENLIEYATNKLKNKNLDLIVANSALEQGSGFATDTNKVVLLDKHNKMINFELKSKTEIAKDIVNTIISYL